MSREAFGDPPESQEAPDLCPVCGNDWHAEDCVFGKEVARRLKAERDVRKAYPECTTLVSYSDLAAGHGGALYRACNWWWAPTWLRLRPPPSGNGSWRPGEVQAVKDRWVYPLRKDAQRAELLVAKDDAILKRMPWARYTEPGGADYKRWKMSQTHNAERKMECDPS